MLCIMRGDLDKEVVPGSGVNTVIKEGKAWTQEKLIGILNPIITGWANYHQSIVSKEIFGKLDYRVWNMLWKWAKRRHPNKSYWWIAK